MSRTETIQFSLSDSSREARDWSKADKDGVCRGGARRHAMAYARANGAAGMAWADGRYTLYFVENGKLRQTTCWVMPCLSLQQAIDIRDDETMQWWAKKIGATLIKKEAA